MPNKPVEAPTQLEPSLCVHMSYKGLYGAGIDTYTLDPTVHDGVQRIHCPLFMGRGGGGGGIVMLQDRFG